MGNLEKTSYGFIQPTILVELVVDAHDGDVDDEFCLAIRLFEDVTEETGFGARYSNGTWGGYTMRGG